MVNSVTYRTTWNRWLTLKVHGFVQVGQYLYIITHNFPESIINWIHCTFLTFYSLEGRFEDEELQQLLEDIKTKRSFQYWGRLLFVWIKNDFRQAADIDTDHVTLIFRLALEASLNLFGFLMSHLYADHSRLPLQTLRLSGNIKGKHVQL